MNLILEKSSDVRFYTYLKPLFDSLPELTAYYWLVSDLEVNYCADERLAEGVVLDGKTLNEIVQANDVQFIWAVLSAFETPPPAIPDDLPYADGNPKFWTGSPRPQAEGAAFEIVCWDSSATLFIGLSDHLVTKLRKLYPDVHDLDEDNRARTKRFSGHGRD